MRHTSKSRLGRLIVVIAIAALSPACAPNQKSIQTVGETVAIYPKPGAVGVNPDAHLTLTFASPPQIGASGRVQIFDASSGEIVDTLDMSVPPSPRPNGRATESTEAQRQALARSTRMEDFQVDTIGGIDFHFFPVIVRGNTATIYPHQGKLTYDRSYRVQIDPEAIRSPETAQDPRAIEWTFSTREAPPKAGGPRYVVAADGSGDFNTVQGAIDFVPDAPASPVTIFIRNGNYEELVFANGKSNLILRGEDREKVVVGYPNNSSFNPPRNGPSRRPAFSLFNVKDVQLSTFTIKNYFIGQAEALLVRGDRVVIDRMTLNGSGDALTTRGSIYMVDSTLTGDGDTILGYASLFCLRCQIDSVGPFTWTRTPKGQHGNVFVDSRFNYLDKPLPWTVSEANPAGQKTKGVLARLPRNGPAGSEYGNFPHAEMVLIDSVTDGVPPEGWGPIEGPDTFDWSNVRFWEFNTRNAAGDPIDPALRHPIVKQLSLPADAETIRNYRTPEFVLGGWNPVVVPESGK